MVKTIEYHSVGSEMHGITGLEIRTPEGFLHRVASQPGPILDDLKAPNTRKVLWSGRDQQGIPMLGFDFAAMGRGYSGQPFDRSARAMAMVSQIEHVAALDDITDPRFQLRGMRTPWSDFDRDPLEVSFEAPTTDLDGLAERVRDGMLRAARNLRLYQTQADDKRFIHVGTVGGGEVLAVRAEYVNANPVLLKGGLVEEGLGTAPRVVLRGERDGALMPSRMRHARLVAIAGIISTLRPLE